MKASNKKAVLILDIQDDFTRKDGKYPVDSRQAEDMIQNVNRLLFRLKESDFIIVYIGNEFSKYNPLNVFRNFAAVKGSAGAKMDERLNVMSQNYFPKNWDNSFTNPALDEFLKSNNISDVFIAGVKAEACVRATAKGAMRRGYKTSILTDCIATGSEKKRNRLIKKYEQMGINVLTSDDLN